MQKVVKKLVNYFSPRTMTYGILELKVGKVTLNWPGKGQVNVKLDQCGNPDSANTPVGTVFGSHSV